MFAIAKRCLGRSSYVLWDEKVIPLFALEIVSKTPGKEQTKKFEIYRSIGILYYLVYAPLRKRKARFQLEKAKAASQQAEAASQRAEAESQRADLAIAAQTAVERENIALRQRLRDLGIDPDETKAWVEF